MTRCSTHSNSAPGRNGEIWVRHAHVVHHNPSRNAHVGTPWQGNVGDLHISQVQYKHRSVEEIKPMRWWFADSSVDTLTAASDGSKRGRNGADPAALWTEAPPRRGGSRFRRERRCWVLGPYAATRRRRQSVKSAPA